MILVIDCEGSSSNPYRASLLSIGAVEMWPGQDSREFYGECYAPCTAEIQEEALAVNGFKREEIGSMGNKQHPTDLVASFMSWARQLAKPKEEIILAGHNLGAYDMPLLRLDCYSNNPFSYRTLDLHTVAYALLGSSMNSGRIYQALGMELEPKPHNALTGAKWEREAFRRLFDKLKQGEVS